MGGNASTHAVSSSRARMTLEERKIAKKFESKFTASELSLLSRVFRDLARRSPKATVDPEHFDEYVCFPGLHGEQVFRAFDTKKTGNLDFEEFVSGLARSARGTKDEKVRFLFEIYDLKGDGFVWKSELQRLINHVPRSALHHHDTKHRRERGTRDHRFVTPTPAGDEHRATRDEAFPPPPPHRPATSPRLHHPATSPRTDDEKAHFLVEVPPADARTETGVARHRFSRAASSPLEVTTENLRRHVVATSGGDGDVRKLDEDASPASSRRFLHFEDTNDDMVEEAFEKCDLNKDGKLSFEQFTLWIDSAPEVLEFVDQVFERAMTAAVPRALESPKMKRTDSASGHRSLVGGEGASSSSAGKRPASADALKRNSSEGNLVNLPPSSEDVATLVANAAAELQSSPQQQQQETEQWSLSPTPWHDEDADERASPARKEGHLQKIGAKMSAITTRYFVLIGNCLYYFVKKGDGRPRGLIFLGGCQIEKLPTDGPHHSLRFGFRIVHLDAERLGQRQHTLYASSAKDRDEWVEALIGALSSPRWSRKNGSFDVKQYYDLGQELGTGRFAVARKATDRKTGAVVAVKSIEKRASLYNSASDGALADHEAAAEKDEEQAQSPNPKMQYGTTMAKTERAMFRREIAVMRLARHQSILPLLAVFEDRSHVHLVMPLMECDLATYLTRRQEEQRPCDESDARQCLPVVIEAVAYLHHLGVAHRDLKPDNILMEDANDLTRLRLADFSISQILKPDETIHKAAGSIEYMAPEVFLKHLGAGFPADVWALGVIAILVLFYQQPFQGDSKSETIGNVLERQICPLPWDTCSPAARDLFETRMLDVDPNTRITAQDAFENHPWVLEATGVPGLKRALSAPVWHREVSEYSA